MMHIIFIHVYMLLIKSHDLLTHAHKSEVMSWINNICYFWQLFNCFHRKSLIVILLLTIINMKITTTTTKMMETTATMTFSTLQFLFNYSNCEGKSCISWNKFLNKLNYLFEFHIICFVSKWLNYEQLI